MTNDRTAAEHALSSGDADREDIQAVFDSRASWWQAQRVARAATAWASLVWRPGSERPERKGLYLCAVRDLRYPLLRPERADPRLMHQYYYDHGWEIAEPVLWLDGALPPVPTEGG